MLDIRGDAVALTAALVDVESVSGSEKPLADLVEEALGTVDGLAVVRDGDTVIGRTDRGRDRRILLAGHLGTVPVAGSLPARPPPPAPAPRHPAPPPRRRPAVRLRHH